MANEPIAIPPIVATSVIAVPIAETPIASDAPDLPRTSHDSAAAPENKTRPWTIQRAGLLKGSEATADPRTAPQETPWPAACAPPSASQAEPQRWRHRGIARAGGVSLTHTGTAGTRDH